MEGEVKYVLTDDDGDEKEIKVRTAIRDALITKYFRETQPVATSENWR